MSGSFPQDPALALDTQDWRVRAASPHEAGAVAAAVHELLRELGGTPPAAASMEAAARVLVEDPEAGAVLVADAAGELIGVLAASWQTAIHVPGRYALIQDLWVHQARRGSAIGSGLLAALREQAKERGVTRIEVGIPHDGFPQLEATQRFYLRNGFSTLGARMRWVLP